MIEDNGVVFRNLNGFSAAFNNDTWPLTEFTPEPSFRGNRIERMEEPGEWPTRTTPGVLLVHTHGDLVCSTAELYSTNSLNMANILVPAGVIDPERIMGRLSVKYWGVEWLDGDCSIDGMSLPKTALYPTVGEWDITYRVFAGYMVGRSTGNPYTLV